MADVNISPNMNLPIPVPGVDAGPDWANNYNASLSAVDSHNHTTGQGVPITPDGMDINSTLDMKGQNLTQINAALFNSLVASIDTLVRSLQVVGVDLYFVDGAGNAVRITQSGAVTGATGTITGLPSGTASASFAGGAFTFESATNTPATMNVGPLVIGSATANAKTVTIAPSASQPSNYALVWPLALAAGSLTTDISGNMAFVPIGSSVVNNAINVSVAATPTWTAVTSVTVTAGTWLISANFTLSGLGGSTFVAIAVSTTTASSSGTTIGVDQSIGATRTATGITNGAVGVSFKVTPVGSTTYYLNAQLSASDSSCYGSITAVRIA